MLDPLAFSIQHANGAADKPRRAGKPQAFSPGVGLIRVVAWRKVLHNHTDIYPPLVIASAKRLHYGGLSGLSAGAPG